MTPSSAHVRARLAAGAAFFVQGLLFISLTTRLPDIQDRWGLDELAVSGLLLMVVLLAGVGSVVAEVVARRASSAVVLRAGLAGLVAGFVVLLAAPGFGVFVAGLAVYGVALGMVDAATNMQAVTVEHLYGRPILPSFHGFWTAGGILATVLTLMTSSVELGLGLGWLVVLPALVVAAPFTSHDRSRVAADADAARPVGADVPWRRILLLGLAMVLFYMVDTAATTWGPIYLTSAVSAPSGLTALATLPYLVAAFAARAVGDQAVDRFGAVRVLRVGGVVACGALALVVFASHWMVAVVGFTILGAAAATIAPLSFSAAGVVAAEHGAQVDAVIARFNQFNYVGGLLGAVLTGAVGADNLRIGFAVPMVLILLILPLATQFALVRRSHLTPID